jgi:hypothetical protein
MSWFYLILAIGFEVTATALLKISHQILSLKTFAMPGVIRHKPFIAVFGTEENRNRRCVCGLVRTWHHGRRVTQLHPF